jgi:hypothetical protein
MIYDIALAVGFALAVATVCVTSMMRHGMDPLWKEARRVERRQRRIRTREIAELPENELGRIVGRVAALERSLIAPLSGRPCVYYAVIVEEVRPRGWQELVAERRGVAFAIKDYSGKAIIDPANASVALRFDCIKYVDGGGALTQEQASLLAHHGVHREGFFAPSALRFQEAVIPIGHHVEVTGAGVREPDPEAHAELGYRDAPTQICISNSAAAPLSIDSDLGR